MRYVLTLDAGTTALKGSLFDTFGRRMAGCMQEYTLLKPAPDIVEMKAETYWQAAVKVIQTLLSSSRMRPVEILSVGITSQGETLIVLDRNGHPLRNAIVWLDNRSRGEASAIGAAFGLDTVYRITGQQEMVPTWTATRIEWLHRHEPQTYAHAHKYLLVADYLIYRLTGRCATDHAMNPSTLYYDVVARGWWPEMLQRLGVRPDQLPELRTSGEVVGTLSPAAALETGLNENTHVSTAPIDQVAGAIGAGNLEPGVITESTGAAMALCATLDRPTYDPQKRVGLYAHAAADRYALLPWVPTAGMVLRWFRDVFGSGLDYEALIEDAAEIEPGAEGLILLPHLSGAFCPEADSRAKGVFHGISLGHHRGHFVRAILEAVAFMLRENLEMLKSLGVPVREMRSLGGAARSDPWLQIKADICRQDILVMDCEEAASLGVAMISFVSNGTYRSLEEAREQMVRVRQRVSHRADVAIRYDAVYDRYRKLYQQLKGTF